MQRPDLLSKFPRRSGFALRRSAAASFILAHLLGALALGCSSDDAKSDEDYQRDVTRGMHQQLLSDVQELHAAAQALATAAPEPADGGWDEERDAAAIAAMQSAWKRARSAYERTEGALAPLFPELDAAIDARYDDFLEELGAAGDPDLFDAEGVTGMHAIERILYAHQIAPAVVESEESLPGYAPAAWPTTREEAAEFKQKLCARLIDDTGELVTQWQPQRIDVVGAFQGLSSLMNEQREKVVKASSFEQESRYADRTMADIRDNLAGTRSAYAVFQAWLLSKEGGAAIDAQVEAGFSALEAAYARVEGDAVPTPPDSWSSEHPDAADPSEFGKLYASVFEAVDPNREGSVVDGMDRAAAKLGFPVR